MIAWAVLILGIAMGLAHTGTLVELVPWGILASIIITIVAKAMSRGR